MEMDGELYRKAYQAIKKLKEQEYVERVQEARIRTPQQAWDQFAALYEFGIRIAPENHEYQHHAHLRGLQEYLLRIKMVATRRQSRAGNT
jgi:hypothetical protein